MGETSALSLSFALLIGGCCTRVCLCVCVGECVGRCASATRRSRLYWCSRSLPLPSSSSSPSLLSPLTSPPTAACAAAAAAGAADAAEPHSVCLLHLNRMVGLGRLRRLVSCVCRQTAIFENTSFECVWTHVSLPHKHRAEPSQRTPHSCLTPLSSLSCTFSCWSRRRVESIQCKYVHTCRHIN